jgi:hypothetical protein
MPARSDLELDMINYTVTMNNYTINLPMNGQCLALPIGWAESRNVDLTFNSV